MANPITSSIEPHQEGPRCGVRGKLWGFIKECLSLIRFGVFDPETHREVTQSESRHNQQI